MPAREILVIAHSEAEAVQKLQVILDNCNVPMLVLGVSDRRPIASA